MDLAHHVEVVDECRVVGVGDEPGEVAAEVLLAEADHRVIEREAVDDVAFRGRIAEVDVVEGDGAADVAALLALGLDFENGFLRREVERVAFQREARDADDAGLAAGLRVLEGVGQGTVEINPVVLRKVRVEGDAEHPVF